MKKSVTISITATDIRRAITATNPTKKCPLHQAFGRRWLKRWHRAWYTGERVMYVTHIGRRNEAHYKGSRSVPEAVSTSLARFDRCRKMDPVTFQLEL